MGQGKIQADFVVVAMVDDLVSLYVVHLLNSNPNSKGSFCPSLESSALPASPPPTPTLVSSLLQYSGVCPSVPPTAYSTGSNRLVTRLESLA